MSRRMLMTVFAAMLAGSSALYIKRRELLAFFAKLPPVQYKVRAVRNFPIITRDGLKLMTDLYTPEYQGMNGTTFPTILIRSPYGRGYDNAPASLGLAFAAERFAERGYNVVVQTTRGQFDSEGEFIAYINEKNDGLDTIAWIQKQPWFNGVLGTWGPSYLGIVQWAVAADAPIKAMVPMITASRVSTLNYPDGAFGLGGALSWGTMTANTNGVGRKTWTDFFKTSRADEAKLRQAEMHLPIYEADMIAAGRPVPHYRRWLDNLPEPGNEYWRQADHTDDLEKINAPIHLISGWYDIWARETMEDYALLKAAGKTVYLTFGPWKHVHPGPLLTGFAEGLAWFDAHLKGQTHRIRSKPVRVYMMGAGEWREMDDWPPPSTPTHYHLRGGGSLSRAVPDADEYPDHYRYDPADPTPQYGGNTLDAINSGPVDNRELEARKDVLVYSTPPLTAPIEIMGRVKMELYVKSSLAHTDFFARLCDVDPEGKSINLCDGLIRLEPGKVEPQPDGTLRLEIDMRAVAHRFNPGHRVRIIVASGSHPRWSRNTGSGEPLAHATTLCTADQTIYHDDVHPSAVVLPLTLD